MKSVNRVKLVRVECMKKGGITLDLILCRKRRAQFHYNSKLAGKLCEELYLPVNNAYEGPALLCVSGDVKKIFSYPLFTLLRLFEFAENSFRRKSALTIQYEIHNGILCLYMLFRNHRGWIIRVKFFLSQHFRTDSTWLRRRSSQHILFSILQSELPINYSVSSVERFILIFLSISEFNMKKR